MLRSQRTEHRRQFAARSITQPRLDDDADIRTWGVVGPQPFTLSRNPCAARFDEGDGLALRAPTRKRDTHGAVRKDAQNVASRRAVPDELDRALFRGRRAAKRQPELHGELR